MKLLESEGAHARRPCAFVHHAVFEPSPSPKSIFMLHATCTLPLWLLASLLSGASLLLFVPVTLISPVDGAPYFHIALLFFFHAAVHIKR